MFESQDGFSEVCLKTSNNMSDIPCYNVSMESQWIFFGEGR